MGAAMSSAQLLMGQGFKNLPADHEADQSAILWVGATVAGH